MSKLTSSAVESALSSAEDICRARGSRLTTKRRQVLAGLLDSDKALSAYELTDYCREQLGYQLPAMSVYRILDFLENEDLVHRLNLAKKYVACSHITCKHAHQVPQFLICKRCSKVNEIGIDAELVQSLKNHIDEAGYSLASQQLEFDCLCADCSVDVEPEART